MDFNFEAFFKSIKTDVVSLAQESLKDSFKEAKADGMAALNSMKENIKKWSLQVVDKEITIEDFEFQIQTQKEEMEMEALKEAGLKAIELDKFKNGIVGIVVNKISGLV
ncbi:MAG TPA: hypothetical protein VMU83_05775 [Hanamia sp.]|nr:hypothetical protein [Hanamia sp.]